DDVLLLDDAEIAVNRLGGMEEQGRCAGARQRRRDLAADDPRLAHAREHDASTTLPQELHRAIELAIQPPDERQNRRRFRLEDLARERQVRHWWARCGSAWRTETRPRFS